MAYTRSQNKSILAGVLITYCCVLHLTGANAAIYKWVDSNGTTHYSDKRPKDKSIKHSTVNISIGNKKRKQPDADTKEPQPAAQTTPQKQTAINITDIANQAEVLKKKKNNIKTGRQLRCEQARTNVAILAKDIPVYTSDAGQYRLNWAGDTYTGQRSYLDDAARETAHKKAELAINNYCQSPNDTAAQQMAAKKWANAEYCAMNRAILNDLQRADIKASKRQLNKQQALTDKYCDDTTLARATDEPEPEIFPR